MTENIRELQAKIEHARTDLKRVCTSRANLAGALSGLIGTIQVEFEFPEPGTAHVYQMVFGHRMEEPTTYRLSFSDPPRWIGISHPWGTKPADITVMKTG
ncbi:MAG: hypothetical protein MASP_01929 [Candidatus Methanolliviera sp. GoM_asphalt]|nr:MAG: hypothetical protein MASP_01929 [Candidatus Methanolliviera sp. GoM_asphalt]